MSDIQIERLKRKLSKKDNKIKGLENRIVTLERKLAMAVIDLPRTVERSVTDVLMNVRFFPVGPTFRNNKIIEIREVKDDEQD